MTMFDTASNKLLAICFAVALSTLSFATAIVPASPTGFIA